jgi:hypothetical protein
MSGNGRRHRWFCCLCGAITLRDPGTGPYAFCYAHSRVAVDEVPPDPLESLPMQSADTIHGEDTAPAAGTESC